MDKSLTVRRPQAARALQSSLLLSSLTSTQEPSPAPPQSTPGIPCPPPLLNGGPLAVSLWLVSCNLVQVPSSQACVLLLPLMVVPFALSPKPLKPPTVTLTGLKGK